tara:strand:- start:610 stop:1053 length:444 start_codon:yes stop_codon:yes gene_type:complete
MKLKRFWFDTGSFYYIRNNVEDILNIKRFKSPFKSFKEVCRTKTERKGKQIAKDMFTDMMQMIADDLIKNDYFVLPRKNFGYMTIADTADPNRKDYVYSIETSGSVYSPILKLSKKELKTAKKNYKLRFNQHYRNIMCNEINNGGKY